MADLFDKNKRVLILVESPEKSRTITKIFRDAGYKNVVVQATIGHFSKIADGGGYHNTGIYPEKNFEANYVIDPNKKDVVKKLKEQVKLADLIYICSDPDREGEAIAWSCLKFLGIPKTKCKRATYQAINQKAIFESIKNASGLNDNKALSAHARKCVDKGLAYKLIDALSKEYKSMGRCQGASLKMIADRENEILNFKPEKYFDLYLHFFKNNVEFKAKYVGTDKNQIKRLDNQEQANNIIKECNGNSFIVKDIEFKDKKENPKPPFSTATFQQECANKLGLTVKQSADCAQQLFETGKISYHRTDSEEFAEEFTSELKQFVKDNFDKEYVSGKVVKGKKDENAQEGHEALHVLDLNLTPEKFAEESNNDLLTKVYRIIYNRTVATALNPAIIAQTIYNIYNKENKFVLNSNELKFDGYRCVYSYKDEDEDKEPIVKETFSKGEELKECSLETAENETKPPARYKEASFVAELKKVGIGRPSTYASLIEILKSESRGYCEVENKCLKPTEKGMRLFNHLSEKYPKLIEIEYTKNMEKALDEIEEGKRDAVDYLKEIYDDLDRIIPENNRNNTDKTCPICGAPMKLRKGRYGNFFGCSNYPNCNGMRKANGEEIKK